MACALIHSPPLLILDEPTVGTDPKLRQTIWLHLRALCDSGVTVILTTHYIEEARNANVVAFMRNGRILAEDEPNIILENNFCNTLEEVFLKLCDSEDNDNNHDSIAIEIQNNSYENEIINEINDEIVNSKPNNFKLANLYETTDTSNYEDHFEDHNKNETNILRDGQFLKKVSALSNKNAKRLTRNWIQLVLLLIFPSLEFGMLLYSVGIKPTNLKLAIFNEELNNNISTGWGQLFVNSIDNNIFIKNNFNAYEEAMDSVKSGQTYALIDINDMFSKALRLRALYGSNADEETLEESLIRVHIDWTNQMIGLEIERYLYEAIIKFAEEVAKQTNTNVDSIKIPLSFEEPVNGIRSESLRDFILPSTFVIIFYYGISIVSAQLILQELNDGTLERTIVAGITALDFLFSHFFTQLIILLFQFLLMLSIPFFVLNTNITYTTMLIIPLVLSQGFCGITFGLFVAVVCQDVLYSAMFIISSLFLTIVLSGVFWPMENIPYILQICGHFTPNALSIQSFRYILYREWTLDYYGVYIGFVVTYVWIAFFLIFSLILLRRVNDL